MRLLADTHISPKTVAFLRSLGHDAVRVNDVLPANTPDSDVIALTREGASADYTDFADSAGDI